MKNNKDIIEFNIMELVESKKMSIEDANEILVKLYEAINDVN